MPVYAEAASGYRDATKWLTAFVPVTAIATAGVTLGPALVESVRQTSGAGAFSSGDKAIVVAMVLGVIGLVCIVVPAAKVLSVEPTDIGAIYADKKAGPELATALGAGALAPYFLDQPSFDQALAALSAAQAARNDDGIEPLMDRLEPATEVLREWAVFHVMRRRFGWFLFWLVVGSAVVAVGLIVAASNLPKGSAIDKPVPITAELDQEASADLMRTTGCRNPETTVFVAVDGTWDEPDVAVSGPGCVTAHRWRPDLNHAIIAPAA